MKNKGLKNVIYGLFNQLVTIVFGLILPRMFIMSYGSEVNGLISSVNQMYAYVALLEAGIGTASLQALYKTIAKNDINATNSVLSATNYFYKKTGYYYLIAVILLALGYPLVVSSSIPYWTIFGVILFNGLGGVINYFFQGKFRILLRAEGENYILSNLSTTIYILSNFSKIILIWFGFSVVVTQIVYFLLTIVQMIFIMYYIRKNYSWIDLSVKPDIKSISSKNSVLVHQISNLIFSNTDVIILTLFSGLKSVSVYSIYNSFFNMVKSVLYSFLDGIQFLLGQTYNADFNKFKKLQDLFEACYMTMTFVLYSILYVVITPFISIYTRDITDINYIDVYLPLLFTLVFLLQGARGPMQLVTEYAGHFKQTRNQAIIEMVINISVSILCVLQFGIYGVLLGTIAALLYRVNAIIIYVNKKILIRSPWKTYFRWGWCAIIFIVIFFINLKLNVYVESYIDLVLFGVLSSIVITFFYSIAMYLFEREALFFIMKTIKNKIPFIKHN